MAELIKRTLDARRPYDQWVEREGIPVYGGYFIEDPGTGPPPPGGRRRSGMRGRPSRPSNGMRGRCSPSRSTPGTSTSTAPAGTVRALSP